MDAGRHFHYRNVQIYKSQSLGIGSYGAVYRARCDQLPCAAKLLHPILSDPRAPRNQQCFEQECQFLNGIRHPHIVQYLGTCRDTETGLPVLLMELMDSNLTHFLEESQERLPYHLEVNLCHDIALALAYLHSNGIIHRDLSSNNVLLIAGSRAKVTDFGMSKLIDATPRMTPLTQCPGTVAYMAPEAVRETPMYTDKLDCFAHGVLAIQIMTREFPNPSQATQLVDDPQSPTGTTYMPVLERERRKSHIDRIDPHHPLLPIAIQCLSYNEKNRPSAQQLCTQLAVLKEDPPYIHSMQCPQQEDQRLREELEQATRDNLHRDGRISELQEQLHEKDAAVVTSQQEIQRLTQRDQQLTQDNQRLAQDNQRHTQDNQRLTQDNQRLTQDNQRLTQRDQRLTQDYQRLTQNNQQLAQDNQRIAQDIQRLWQEVREKDNTTEGRERQLRDSEHIIAEFQQTVVQKDKRIRDLEEIISTREIEIQEQPKPPFPPPQPKPREQQKRSEASNTAVDTIKLNWRQCPKAPCKMFRGSATVDGSMAYFRPGGSNTVHAYDSDKEVWSQMPECPYDLFALAMVKGLLTAVGGKQSLFEPTNTLLSLTGKGSKRKWSKHFPPMPTKRYLTAVVCSGRPLVVAGGAGDHPTKLSTVEVMDTESLQWFTASSLPHPLSHASATICGENLYLLEGIDQNGTETKAVFTCSLSALLKSCQPQSLGARLKRSLSPAQEPTIWHQVADIPVYLSTCTTLCGHLLAVGGGRDSDYNTTTAIYKYDPVKNTWTVISHMPTPRWQGLVAVLPGDKVMVVGGRTSGYYGSDSDVVEIATVL